LLCSPRERYAKKWLRDGQGNPVVVYHGAPSEFTQFAPGRKSWFTVDPEFAAQYATGAKGRVLHLHATIDNPAVFEKTREGMLKWANTQDEVLRRAGHDGVAFVAPKDATAMLGATKAGKVYAPGDVIHGYVFNPKQLTILKAS
jgi:hypothetical protein